MENKVKFLVAFLMMSLLCHICTADKLLVFPFPYPSHVAQLLKIASGMHDNGHEVYVVLPPSYPDVDKIDSKYNVIGYEVKNPDFYSIPSEEYDAMWAEMMQITPEQEFREHMQGIIEFCTNPLQDKKLYNTLKDLKIALALIDGFPDTRCYYILMYRLGIPYVSISSIYEPWVLRNPTLPSHAPFSLRVPESSHMNFWQRLVNTYRFLDWTVFPRMLTLEDSLVSTYAPEMPFKSINQLAGESLLWFMDTDVAVDYPRPLMPNEINIGGLAAKPAQPLPKELDNFLNQSKEDAIVVSFGLTDALPQDVYEKMMSAFKRFKYQFIWRYVQEFPKDIPSNIKLMKWIPQNDILGHPKVKLFITHGGANGQFESVYHGVPVLTFPIIGDQPYNALRAQDLGYGKKMDLRTFTSDDLVDAIEEMSTNPSYESEVKRRSEIFRSHSMTPQKRAVFWMEHVMKYGGKHLHCASLDMPWYQYFMLDILGLVFGCVLLICWILRKLLCSKSSGKEKQE